MREFLLSLLAACLFIAGLLAQNGSLVALTIPIILYLAAGILFAPREIRLSMRRSLSADRVGPGVPVEVTLKVANEGKSLHKIFLDDILPEGVQIRDGVPHRMLSLPSGKEFTFHYQVTGQRGYYQFSQVVVRAFDPFNLRSKRKVYQVPAQLFILPPVMRIRSLNIRPRRTRVYSGVVPARVGGPGVEFFGVREYQPGDSLRWVDWRASARHPANLYSKEFEQERVADVGIILDGRLDANVISGDHSIFEYSASAAATISGAFLSQGNRVGLLIYGEYIQWTYPGYGKLQRERILRSIARARLGVSQVFSNLENIPTRLFPAHSQMVLVSPLTGDDPATLRRLRSRGYRVIVITPNPITFELSLLPKTKENELAARMLYIERDLMLQTLRRAGIQIVDWDVNEPFEVVMNTFLRRLAVLQRVGGGG